jgi:hypothetical protein
MTVSSARRRRRKMGSPAKVYVIETPSNIWWSKRKLTAQYKHVSFLWRDKARYKEMVASKFDRLVSRTTKKVEELA